MDMVDKKRTEEFAVGKRRLEEIGSKLGALLGGKPDPESSGSGGVFRGVSLPCSPVRRAGFSAGLGTLIEQLRLPAERAEQECLAASEAGNQNLISVKRLKGVYGF